jgi:NhaP-type Na+/H+ and K+/H+ antiporter
MERTPRLLVAWYGPRGLSSLLLVSLPVFAGLPGAERMLQLCGVVVLASLLVHGASLVVLTRRTGRAAAAAPAPSTAATAATAPPSAGSITIEELQSLQASGEPVVIGDARKRTDDEAAAGSVRIDPEQAVQSARALAIPKSSHIALYCA